eukprot:Partr_v1_DN23277_c0_g1_i1_m35149 putative B-cell translocation gene
MQTEIQISIKFIVSLLSRATLPADKLAGFSTNLERHMTTRFQEKWDETNPLAGNGFRSIFSDGLLDPIISTAAREAKIESIHRFLPSDFVIWVDPGSVAYRIGEHGTCLTLYNSKTTNKLVDGQVLNKLKVSTVNSSSGSIKSIRSDYSTSSPVSGKSANSKNGPKKGNRKNSMESSKMGSGKGGNSSNSNRKRLENDNMSTISVLS